MPAFSMSLCSVGILLFRFNMKCCFSSFKKKNIYHTFQADHFLKGFVINHIIFLLSCFTYIWAHALTEPIGHCRFKDFTNKRVPLCTAN